MLSCCVFITPWGFCFSPTGSCGLCVMVGDVRFSDLPPMSPPLPLCFIPRLLPKPSFPMHLLLPRCGFTTVPGAQPASSHLHSLTQLHCFPSWAGCWVGSSLAHPLLLSPLFPAKYHRIPFCVKGDSTPGWANTEERVNERCSSQIPFEKTYQDS